MNQKVVPPTRMPVMRKLCVISNRSKGKPAPSAVATIVLGRACGDESPCKGTNLLHVSVHACPKRV